MDSPSELKSMRLLEIYSRLSRGDILKKSELARRFHVTERSIQRDIESLRCFMAEQAIAQEIIYDGVERGYRMMGSLYTVVTNSEILAVCKILLESRSMRKDEMLPILDKLIACCVPAKNRKAVEQLISNEKHHYVEPHHRRQLLDGLWEIGQAVQTRRVMEIQYEKLGGSGVVSRVIEPVGILFSEYYFYLAAFIRNIDREQIFDNPNDLFPTIYRIDRIQSFHLTGEHFSVPYTSRFEEGEFRKRVQFMYGGKLQHIRFRYSGPSIEAVLDRLPTAQIIAQDDRGWIVEAEVFGTGIDMWLRSQGSSIEVEQYLPAINDERKVSHG